MEDVVWHYAPWEFLPEIVSTGFLRASNAGAIHEVPMLWFSANQQWEPTATKVVQSHQGLIRLTSEEQATRFGCIRFGLPANDPRLLSWREACRVAQTSRQHRRGMERLGEKLGARSADWFAAASNVDLSELRFQVWLFKLCWQFAKPAEMAEVWKERLNYSSPSD